LLEDRDGDHQVGVDSVDHSPVAGLVGQPQLVTRGPIEGIGREIGIPSDSPS